jgi:hypothetical protein
MCMDGIHITHLYWTHITHFNGMRNLYGGAHATTREDKDVPANGNSEVSHR